MMIDGLWSSWLAGLVDGEGYFQILPTETRLTIMLREDDRAVLEHIRATLCVGSIYNVSKAYDRERNGRRSAIEGPGDVEVPAACGV